MAMEQQLYPGEQRSEQPLKLFVGQVPKDMTEEQLRPLFEQAGPIAHIMVIRDRQTDAHRGCAFLTYETREAGERAVDKFHNKVKLPNAHNPVQVRPADSQMGDDRAGPNSRVPPVDRENKLFVGMLPHDADDATLTDLFSRFGDITEVYCMRNPDGTPKGCAFVKLGSRDAAIAAIEALHEKFTMDGATRALVVKFADVKKPHAPTKSWLPTEGGGPSPFDGNGLRHRSPSAYWQGSAPHGVRGQDVHNRGRELYPGPYPYQSYPSAHIGMPPSYSVHSYEYQHTHHGGQPRGSGGQGGYVAYSHSPPYATHYGQPGERSLSPSSAGGGGERSQPFGSPSGGPMAIPGGGREPRGDGREGREGRENGEHGSGTRPQEGPPGANLFIYHLPNDLTDADLATAFAPFGHVISAKVFLDKRTGESKGFGFVSFDHPNEAELAISKMNGFQIGSKRLKVQHKKVDSDRDDRDGRGYSSHHHGGGGGREMYHQQQHGTAAPLHGGPGRLGMGYPHAHAHPHSHSHSQSHHSAASSSPEIRGEYQPHQSDMRIIHTGGGDTRVIYAGPLPGSNYDGGPQDGASQGPYTHRRDSVGAHGAPSTSGGGEGGGRDSNIPPSGPMYHDEADEQRL